MMTELPENVNRIRVTRWGLYWNGDRVTYTGLRARLRSVRAARQPVFTLLEYENWVGCAAIDRLRGAVSATLACSEELCGEMIVGGYYRAPRRRPRARQGPPEAIEDAPGDLSGGAVRGRPIRHPRESWNPASS